MGSNYQFDRATFIRALAEWCGEDYNPLVAFPDKTGFSNVAYLYDKNCRDIIEESYSLIAHLQNAVHCPVVIFAEAPEYAPETAYTCKQWLNSL